MSEVLSLFTPIHRRNLLLVPIAVLVILLVLAIFGTQAPKIATTFGGNTVDLRADRAWVFVPGKCVTFSWNLEGIQSLYIYGEGKIGWGEEKFCPSLYATSPTFEITAANGETRSFSLGVHYLPADVIHSLALMALLAPFLVAIYYLAVPRLEQPIPLNITLLLAFVALYLLCLFLQSFRVLTLVSILDGLANIFASPAWQVFGLVLAGLVFVPLVIKVMWKGVERRAWANFIVVITLFIIVLMLYLPFGFDSIGHYEEWVVNAYFQGRPSKLGNELESRIWAVVPHMLGYRISSESYVGYHIANMLMLWGKLVLLYGIISLLRFSRSYAFLTVVLFMVFPVNSALMSLRSIPFQFSTLTLMVAVFVYLYFESTPSRFCLLGIWFGLMFSVTTHEAGYAIILVIPIIWWRQRPRRTWRNANMTVVWYLIPVAKIVYLLILSGAGRPYYGLKNFSGAFDQERSALEYLFHYSGIIGDVYRQTFKIGWQEAFSMLGQNLWIAPSIASVFLVGAVTVYLTRYSDESMFSSRQKMCTWLLGGLLFILPSIGVVMWLDNFNRDLWRMYVYVPIGAGVAVISLLLLILSPMKSFRLRQAIFTSLFLLLMFPAVSRLYVQHHHFVNSANAKAKILLQIVEQAPSFDSRSRLMLVTDMILKERTDAGIGELLTNMFDSAIYMLYQDRRPNVAFLCILGSRCSFDDIDIKVNYLENGTDYSDVVIFRLYDDLSVELLLELPPELNDGQNHTYDPEPLIDTSAPLPPRALSMLASARRN